MSPTRSSSFDNENFADMNDGIDRFDTKSDFNKWLISAITESYMYENLFFVTNLTPFYFIQQNSSNKYINDLLQIIKIYAKNKINHISTDNDHFNVIKIYEYLEIANELSNINLIMCGKLAKSYKPPYIFNAQSIDDFISGFTFKKKHSELSGYVEITLRKNTTDINYIEISKHNICVYTINRIIRIIDKIKNGNKDNLLLDKKMLLEYGLYAIDNNLFDMYKMIKTGKVHDKHGEVHNEQNKAKDMFVIRLVNRIIPEIRQITDN